MIIGIPTEIKDSEKRVAIAPSGVHGLISGGHTVVIERNAGVTAGFTDEDYENEGAKMVADPAEVWSSEMIIKVKEPLPEEYGYFYDGMILFTYLHLAANKELTEELAKKGVVAIGYETMVGKDGSLPLLTPMSQVAGRMAVQIGAQFLENTHGGKGLLIGGIPGVAAGKVVVIGGGVSGTNAAKMAVGLGAEVVILDNNPTRLSELSDIFTNTATTLMSNPFNIEEQLKDADLVIGAVLIPGSKAPQLVTEKMVEGMEDGSVIVDIAVDQGGIVETADHVTTLTNPTYTRHGVIHYSVANMPGAVAKTSTQALTNVTMPYASEIANKGYVQAAKDNPTIYTGINVMDGKITQEGVANSLDMEYVSPSKCF